jgi:hypothetical protein
MKKITKTIVAILLIAVMSMANVVAFADGGISPRLSHVVKTNFNFVATESGGNIDLLYNGYDSFVRAELTVKVQKRFLLVIWNNVGEWSATSTNQYDVFSHTFALNGSGTYRAVFTLKVYGTDGTYDTIEKTIESKY